MIDLTNKIKNDHTKSLGHPEANTERTWTPYAYARTKDGQLLQIIGSCWMPAIQNNIEYYFKCYECLYHDKVSGDCDLYVGTFYNDQIEEFLSV